MEAVPDNRLRSWEPDRWPLAAGWGDVVHAFFDNEAGRSLSRFIESRLAQGAVIYPARPLRALELTPLEGVHVVILGQDPYHGPGQAEGLAFSVPNGVKLPPSLRNIFTEWKDGCGVDLPGHGSLLDWSRRGVLLLNATLTVEDGAAASHARKGWEALTDALIRRVAARASPCVYMLWGAHAQAKEELIKAESARNGREILVLKANHPSPLSASRPPVPFIGCGHFRRAAQWLAERDVGNVFQG